MSPRDLILFLALAAPAASAQEAVRILPSQPSADQFFGRSLDLDQFLVVGGDEADVQGSASGTVELFDGQSGLRLGELVALDAMGGARFGSSVSTEGTLALVGAWGHAGQGAAYLFDLTTGQQLHKLLPNDIQPGDRFGWSVAMHGDLGVVASYSADDQGSNSGAAYVFDLVTGQQLTKLLPNDGAEGDRFGVSVAIHGDRVLVGAHFDDDVANNAGSAYLFDATTGAQLFHLLPSGNDLQAFFYGQATALTENWAVVGTGAALSSGTKDVLVFDLATGQLERTISRSSNTTFSFGMGLDAEGDRVAIGDWRGEAVYVHELSSGNLLSSYSVAEDGPITHQLGLGVAIQGERVAAGAPRVWAPLFQVGRAFLWGGSPAPATPYCSSDVCPCGNSQNASGCVNASNLGALLQGFGSTSVSSDDLLLQSEHLNPGQFCVFFMGTGTNTSPFGNGLRCVSGNIFRFNPVLSTGPQGRASLGPGIAALSCAQHGAAGCIAPGQTWNFQTWYRDPNGPCLSSFNLTNAVSVTFSE